MSVHPLEKRWTAARGADGPGGEADSDRARRLAPRGRLRSWASSVLAHDRSEQRARPAHVDTSILVRGGFDPDTIFAVAGRPLRLTFRREGSLSCSQRVVFPAFGRSAMLPLNESVTLELLPEQAGEYEFSCEAGLLHGRVIVRAQEPEGGRPA